MESKSNTAVPMPPPGIRRHDAEDLISGLPDELLHAILVRLSSAAAAARTSVLSRRWRGVWAHMPELVLAAPTPTPTPSALLDSIDAALNSYAAPTLHSLKIDLTGIDLCVFPAHRIAPWLRFASQRVAGKLCITISLAVKNVLGQRCKEMDDVALPICERATEINLNLNVLNKFVLRLPQTGCFSAMTDLRIACNQMDGGELGRVVSSPMCPRLRKLGVYVLKLTDVSMRSESLECLDYRTSRRTFKLEVTAPMLREIILLPPDKVCIVAPKLEKIDWKGTYDPRRHHFAVASRHLQSLFIKHWSFLNISKSSTRLMERFDTANSLTVSLGVDEEIVGYMNFLKEFKKLPVCETLVTNLLSNDHGLLPKMLYLLRRCSCIRKLKLLLCRHTPSLKISSCTTLGCPCLLPESCRSDDITLDSLEEIGISCFTGSAEQLEFIEVLLSRCNMVTLKRLDITVSSTPVSSEIMEFVERIRAMYSKVQLNVLPREVPKPVAS